MRGATNQLTALETTAQISIHAPRERSDLSDLQYFLSDTDFNPRSSWEERHGKNRSDTSSYQFQSTLLVRGATSTAFVLLTNLQFQSTLLVRGATVYGWESAIRGMNFNPRSSWEERQFKASDIFIVANFNPRSSWEERLTTGIRTSGKKTFQSTLLVRGATFPDNKYLTLQMQFQSTLLVRGATCCVVLSTVYNCISIHAPRERSDFRLSLIRGLQRYFNPRSSWEERRISSRLLVIFSKFQSTLLVRGATGRACRPLCFQNRFQSTLLVRGATSPFNTSLVLVLNFNPRSSW